MIYVNPKQAEFIQAPQRIKTAICGRGFGKSTMIGDEKYRDISEMPGAKTFLLGKTFGQVYTKTLPEIIGRLRDYGLKEHGGTKHPGHFVVCKQPPQWFDKPMRQPKKFENVISFFNGHIIEMLSFDRPDLSRGGSYDAGDLDEAALINYTTFTKTILPLLRGKQSAFKSRRRFSLRVYTSMPWLQSGMWTVDVMKKLAANHPEDYFYMEASARDNVAVLGESYFKMMEEMMDPITYSVEILNKRPTRLPNAYYEFLSEDHLYDPQYEYDMDHLGTYKIRSETDVDPTKPIEPSFDFNAAFTSASIWQDHTPELRCVNRLFVKFKAIDALVDDICNHYQQHPTKIAYIYGGQDGHTTRILNSSFTYYEQISNKFRSRGWTAVVKAEFSSSDIDHKIKHTVMNAVLRENDKGLPFMRFNSEKAKEVWMSMRNSPIRGDFKKNKESEKDEELDQVYATHLSDTVDNYVYPKAQAKVLSPSSAVHDVWFGR